jgi:hypothetical protein
MERSGELGESLNLKTRLLNNPRSPGKIFKEQKEITKTTMDLRKPSVHLMAK